MLMEKKYEFIERLLYALPYLRERKFDTIFKPQI